MIYLYIIACIFLYVLSLFTDITFLGVSNTSEWFTPITYMFIHTNFIHLAMNVICLVIAHKACEDEFYKYNKYKDSSIMLLVFIVFAIAGGLVARQDLVTIGGSGIVYGYIGFSLHMVWTNSRRHFIDMVIFIIAANLISMLVGMNNLLVHFIPMFLGYCYHVYLIHKDDED